MSSFQIGDSGTFGFQRSSGSKGISFSRSAPKPKSASIGKKAPDPHKTACVSAQDILGTLGEGTFGKIYKIKHAGSLYALKTFKKRDLSAGNMKEMDILKRVNHPNVSGAVDVYFSSERCKVCVVMELASRDLRKTMDTPLPLDAVVDIMHSLLCGLAYLHSNYIIHRDIKPENILMFGDTPKIADFGLSSIVPSKTQPYSYSGTPNYLAPELLVSYPTFDNRIDIWAMGLVFLELMTGTLLVDSSNPQEEIQIITDNIGEFPVKLRLHGWNYGQLLPDDPFETIPDPWNKLIQDMLIIDPDTRPSATLLLEEYFENYPSGCRIDAVLYPPYRVNLAPNYARVRETWLKSAFVASAQGEELLDYQVFFLGVDIADRFFSLYRSATDEEVEEYLPACFSLGACLLKEDTGDADEPQKCKIVDVLKFSLFRPTADIVYPHIDLDDIADMMIRVPMEV